MRTLRSSALAAGLLSILTLAGCSTESGSREDNGELYIVSCSLACTNGVAGEQVFCSIVNTYQNQELSILFSEAIDLFSVNSSSFRVVNVANGTSPSGQFFGDPLNPRRLIFRPSLTFNANGTPIFGFKPDTSYEITIPGAAQGDSAPFIQSNSGRINQSRLQCTIFTSEGVIDPVPGAPTVQVFVDVVASYDQNGNPDAFIKDVQVVKDPEVIDAWRESRITFFFNDIMNVATLVNPSTGKAPFIKVQVDSDGNLSSTSDRTPFDGLFTFSVDQERLETTLVFKGTLPFPSAGPDAPISPRRIALTIPDQVQDLVANTVKGGGTLGFVPELSQFGEVTLPKAGGEDFLVSYPSDNSREDGNRSGALWGSGRLKHGFGGGSGRLGDLAIPNGVQVTLNTDMQVFPLTIADGYLINTIADVMGNPDAATFPDTLGNYPDTITVSDGVFEFNSLTIESGGSLRLVGTNPARIYVRGPAVVSSNGLINLSGVTPPDHDSLMINPDTELATPLNAANGGDGAFGGDRFDMAGKNPNMGSLGGESDAIDNPGDHPNGYKGMGVGRVGVLGGGPGGAKFPNRYPDVNTNTDPATNNNHGVTFNETDIFDAVGSEEQCRSLTVGASGGGGAYATAGGLGVSQSTQPFADYPLDASNAPPDTPGGDPLEVGLEDSAEDNFMYDARLLEWQKDYLRGGSGGGGGSNHPYGTYSNGLEPPIEPCIGLNTFFRFWHDHSAARGGFGGGALHLVSGKRIQLDGEIDASGGRGGQARQDVTPPPGEVDWGQFAMPGGGGSGGAVKLQSIVVDLASVPSRINVAGGPGGGGPGEWSLSVGGMGGTGLVRIEDIAGLAERDVLAPFIHPYEPADDSLDWVSVDNGVNPADGPGWVTPLQRPGSMTASSSCWIFPSGNFFALFFVDDEDDPNNGDPLLMGWNMNVLYQPDDMSPEEVVPFRGMNSFFPNSFEVEFGKNLGTDGGTVTAAPVVVRFQGARATGDFERCDFDLNQQDNGIEAGSITPWVDHPILLNDFVPAPNMIRFVVIFDGTRVAGDNPGSILSAVKGVTALSIRALPD